MGRPCVLLRFGGQPCAARDSRSRIMVLDILAEQSMPDWAMNLRGDIPRALIWASA